MGKRLANESSETRAARLERMKLAQHQRLATESSQERELKDLKVYTETEMIAKR